MTDKDRPAKHFNPDDKLLGVDEIIGVAALVGLISVTVTTFLSAIIVNKLYDKVEEKWEERQERKKIKPKWWE